jgi:hypothetical protein
MPEAHRPLPIPRQPAPGAALPPRRRFPTPPYLLHPWSRASMQSSPTLTLGNCSRRCSTSPHPCGSPTRSTASIPGGVPPRRRFPTPLYLLHPWSRASMQSSFLLPAGPHPFPSPKGRGKRVRIHISVEASRCARGAHSFTLGELVKEKQEALSPSLSRFAGEGELV